MHNNCVSLLFQDTYGIYQEADEELCIARNICSYLAGGTFVCL